MSIQQRPNILMILVDEMRADALACFGNPLIQTPNLDRLASRGTRFAQCMIPQPTCTPCRASLLSGCHPSALRSRMVGCVTPDDSRLLPRILSAAGYRTASIGKIHLGPQGAEPAAVEATRQADGTYDYYGFQHVDLVNGHGDHCFGPRYTPWLKKRVPDLDERRRSQQQLCTIPDCRSWPFPAEVHSSEYIADRSVEFLAEIAEEGTPFFLHCSFPDPHHPFTVPEPYAGMYSPADMPPPLAPLLESSNPPQPGLDAYAGKTTELKCPGGGSVDRIIGTPPRPFHSYSEEDYRIVRAITAGMITQLDTCIGRILETLKETGLAENTIVVFASDHGDYLGDYGLFGKGLHYDCILRSPLLLAGPGVPRGRTITEISSLLDVTPTLLDWIGLKEPDALQGFSMAPSLAGQEGWPRDAALTENDDDMAGLRMRTLTTAHWKFTLYAGEDYGELYNRQDDPHERQNLWGHAECADVQAAMTQALADHMLCASDGANGRVQIPAPPVKKHAPRRLPERFCSRRALVENRMGTGWESNPDAL